MSSSAPAVLARFERRMFQFAYWILNFGGVHRYMSTHCQHGNCQGCRDYCKMCGAGCICARCHSK